MRTLKSLFARVAPPAVTVGGLLIVWEIAVDAGHISQRVLASPSQIAASIVKTWPDLWEATAITTYEAITGFLIAAVAGVLIGIGLYVSKTLYRGIYPLLAAAQTPEDVSARFEPRLEKLLSQQKAQKHNRTQEIVIQINQRLEQGFRDTSIGAQSIAEEMGVSAAYLRKQGADTVEVKRMFKSEAKRS